MLSTFVGFVYAVAASLIDPLQLAGYAVAGLFIRRVWGALGAAVLWAVAVELLVIRLANTFQADYQGGLLPVRITGALVAAALFYLLAWTVRSALNRRKSNGDNPSTLAQEETNGNRRATTRSTTDKLLLPIVVLILLVLILFLFR